MATPQVVGRISEVSMAKPKWSEAKIKEFERAGRGKGTLATYSPWVQVSDFSSLGKSRRVFSSKTGRVHHLLSDVEYQLFLLLEYADHVVDIREQYPLKRDETLSIAAKKQIKHPSYPGTNVATVMTTDFLVTVNRAGQKSLEAYSCKRDDGVGSLRDVEKLEIERTYFDQMGVPFHLVLHSALPAARVKNLEWLRGAEDDSNALPEGQMHGFCLRMLQDLAQAQHDVPLSEYCANFDMRVGAERGTGLLVARALLARRQLLVDLNQPNLAATPMAMFQLAQAQTQLKIVGG